MPAPLDPQRNFLLCGQKKVTKEKPPLGFYAAQKAIPAENSKGGCIEFT
jgi:hypothetical protein